jgi:cell division protein ZapE
MLLGGLFQALFERGVTLVATSNIIPDGLYRDGLQRERFLPAIALLNKHTQVLNVDGGVDYRLRTLEQAELYHAPLDAAAEENLKQAFAGLVMNREHIQYAIELDVEGRFIHVRQMGEGVAWFNFRDLCDGPRSQNDYIELGRIFHTVLIANVPQMGVGKEDQARRFINLVDEFYDRQVKLMLSAEVPLAELYSGGRLSFEFERTKSRLLEMQSKEYLARAHRG